MKTLIEKAIEKAIEFERSQAPSGTWNPETGAPYTVAHARYAFMAGAAAMAEIFAEGYGFKMVPNLNVCVRSARSAKDCNDEYCPVHGRDIR